MEELLKELKESRGKLVNQEQAAKGALQQMQKEMAYRVEQVQLEAKRSLAPRTLISLSHTKDLFPSGPELHDQPVLSFMLLQ